jgi:pimeloyl-ACP methyl ester carboxylesterase
MTTIAIALVTVSLPAFLPPRGACDTVTFDSHGSTIVGCFYAASVPHPHTMIFTQGFMDAGDIWGMGEALADRGTNVLMFDFRGCFDSEGKQGLMNSQDDVGAALAFLSSDEMVARYRIDPSHIIVGGYSYGGHMSMLYAVHHAGVGRVISISGGDLGILARLMTEDPDVRKRYSEVFRSLKRPDGPVEFAYEDPIQELLENRPYFSILDQADRLSDRDILMTGGLDDRVVSMADFLLPLYRKLKARRNGGLRFIVYQTDHSYENVSARLIDDVSDWINWS